MCQTCTEDVMSGTLSVESQGAGVTLGTIRLVVGLAEC